MTPDDLADLVAANATLSETAEARRALEDMLSAAHAAHPHAWVERRTFAAAALERAAAAGPSDTVAARLRALHAADLYFALACAAGNAGALARFEREHVAHVGDFVARIDAREDFADEVRQRLRARLLTRAPDRPPRIASYSARGPLGGWLRVCAVREAHELVAPPRPPVDIDAAVAVSDPEIAILKERYGVLVSEAFRRAIERLGPDDRAMLRMHYVDGLTLEQVAAVFRVSRATGARALARARKTIVDVARGELKAAVGGTASADSMIAFVRSRIEIDLAEHLA